MLLFIKRKTEVRVLEIGGRGFRRLPFVKEHILSSIRITCVFVTMNIMWVRGTVTGGLCYIWDYRPYHVYIGYSGKESKSFYRTSNM